MSARARRQRLLHAQRHMHCVRMRMDGRVFRRLRMLQLPVPSFRYTILLLLLQL